MILVFLINHELQFNNTKIWTSFTCKFNWYASHHVYFRHSSCTLEIWSIPMIVIFLSFCPYKETIVRTILYLLYLKSFVIRPFLSISSLVHAWLLVFRFHRYQRAISLILVKQSNPLLGPNYTISICLILLYQFVCLFFIWDMTSFILIICNETYSKLIKLISTLIIFVIQLPKSTSRPHILSTSLFPPI